MATWSWADVKPAKTEPAVKPSAAAVRIWLVPAELDLLDGIAAAAACGRAEMARRIVLAAFMRPQVEIEEPLIEAAPDAADVVADTPPVVAPAEKPAVRPAGASSRIAEQGRVLMRILRCAPVDDDGAALFMTSVIAKRLTTTELRVEHILQHLEETADLEFRPCTLKGHFRIAVLTRELS